MLTAEERRLIQHCWEHPVASCVPCHAEYRLTELAADLFRGLSHLCPHCRADLSASTREHLAVLYGVARPGEGDPGARSGCPSRLRGLG
jgi:hypothetical protein